MSLIALSKYRALAAPRPAAAAKFETKAALPDLDSVTPAETAEKEQAYAEKVVQHVPSEAVGFYIFAAGLFQSGAESGGLSVSSGRAIVFWLTLVLTPTLAWYLTGKKRADEKQPRPYRLGREHLWKMLAATVAFVVWAAAMPGSVFAGFGWYDPRLAAVLLALVALVLPKVSDAVLRPKPVGDQS